MVISGMQSHQDVNTVNRILLLREVEIFREIDDYTFLENLASKMDEVLVSPNVSIFTQGQAGDLLYILVSGKVRVHIGDLELARLEHGACFDEMSIFEAEPCAVSVTTLEECQCLVISQQQLFEEIKDYPDTVLGIIRLLRRRVQDIQTHTQVDVPNSFLVKELISMALDNACQTKKMVAIVLLKLDHFQIINDTLGYGVGNQLLQEVVERFRENLRQGDVVVRWGPDRVFLLLPHIQTTQNFAAIYQRICSDLSIPFKLGCQEFYVSASLGIALAPGDGEDADTLLQCAESTFYQAGFRVRHDDQFHARIKHAIEPNQSVLLPVGHESALDQSGQTALSDPLAQAVGIANHALQTKLDAATTSAMQLLETDRVILYRFNPNGTGTVVAESLTGEWQSTLGTTIDDCELRQNFTHYYQQGHVRAVGDIYTTFAISPCHLELLERFQIRANLVVPVLIGEQLWGLMIAHECRGPRHWEQHEIDQLKRIATQTGRLIQQVALSLCVPSLSKVS